jgi:Fe-S cluster assembly ATP-binding protein
MLAGRALAPLAQVAGLLVRFDQSMAALRSVDQIMQLPVERPPERNFLHRPVLQGAIEFSNVSFSYPGQQIMALDNVSLKIAPGERVAVIGRIGSGKSTFANTLMGHPRYQVTSGDILFKGGSLLGMETDARSRAGLFLAFQYPVAIPGVTVSNFLRTAMNARLAPRAPGDGTLPAKRGIAPREFRALLRERMALLKMDESFALRYLNDGFSGGERKRAEILQMAMLKPEIAVLDETDSGLDIDALRIVSEGVNTLAGPDLGVLVITHYQRILDYIKPQFVHVLMEGRIVLSGGPELALQLEDRGYDFVREGKEAVSR